MLLGTNLQNYSFEFQQCINHNESIMLNTLGSLTKSIQYNNDKVTSKNYYYACMDICANKFNHFNEIENKCRNQLIANNPSNFEYEYKKCFLDNIKNVIENKK